MKRAAKRLGVVKESKGYPRRTEWRLATGPRRHGDLTPTAARPLVGSGPTDGPISGRVSVQARDATARPFTLPHFQAWAADLILDTGEPWRLEPFQQAFVRDLFEGWPECWLIVPEGNGKTTLLAGLALYHAESRPFAVVPVAAASREQAEIMYRQAEGFVLRSPRLHEPVHSDIQAAKGKLKTEVPRFACMEGYRRIVHHGGGRIQIFASDDRTGDGIIPTLGIIDELHRQRDLSLYRTWAGKLLKRDGQIVAISTAGEPGSDFESTRSAHHRDRRDEEAPGRLHPRDHRADRPPRVGAGRRCRPERHPRRQAGQPLPRHHEAHASREAALPDDDAAPLAQVRL